MAIKFNTFEELQGAVRAFVSERNWHEFHNPKDLSVAIAIEASELMEVMNWMGREKSIDYSRTEIGRQKIGHEIADVVILCASLANQLDLDLGKITADKVKQNEKDYTKELADSHTKKWR